MKQHHEMKECERCGVIHTTWPLERECALRAKVAMLQLALTEIREAVDAGECREDEDCDHCHIIHELIDPALKQ